MTKLLIGLLGAAVVATGGYAAATGLETEPARTVSLPTGTDGTTDGTTTGETTTGETTTGRTTTLDTPTVPTTTERATTAGTTNDDRDLSGPCDEAEHRNDPRCTGAGGDRDDDNSGRGRAGEDDRDDDREDDRDDDDDNNDRDEDRSGSNSGKG
jgi:hypothetical protein